MSEFGDANIDILWQSFLKGDDKSFAIIYQSHINRLLLYGHKLCSDREVLHDCIQEVFLNLFLKRKKLGLEIENLKAYLFVALRNCLIKKMVKNRKHEMLEINDQYDDTPFCVEYSFQDQLIEKEISEEIKAKLQKAIRELPPKQKEIIYLKFEEGMKYDEISEILQISVESARKLMYRAVSSLRGIVDKNTFQILFLQFLKKS